MRDKVKRFISILMTALMLVNLLPVGALAEGFTISNSVQSRASKKSANVYVYVKVTGDKAGLTINQSGWYTIGKSENVPGMGTPYWSMHGSHSFSDVGVSYKTVLKTNFTRWTDNQKIDLDQITWTEFYVDNGADDYVKAGTYTWHMNGTIDIKQLPSVYTIKYVDYDTKELIHSYEESGLMGQTPKKITAPDSWQENLYSFYFVNGHPKEQTVDFKKDKGELTFYYKKNTANYTVNYYLNGTTTKVAAPKKGTAALGSSVTESPITVDGYTPVSGDSKKITIKANSDENVINFYYYKNVELTANSDTATYDGNEHSVSGFTGAPEDADFSAITVGATGTDADTYPANFPKDILNTVDGTGKYIVTEANPGTLTISKRKVTLTSASDEKVYDGTALTNGTVTVGGADGFADGEGATYDVTGSRTDVGESDNTFTYTLNKGTKADNYTIEKTEGKLKVTAATEEVVVTIKENAGTAKYDGTEKTVTGYTVTNISNKLYMEKDFTFNGKAEVKGTDAGTYDMALKASDFTNRNANFSKVTFVIEDGQLVIEKRKVTLTSGSGEKVYDGTALTNGTVTVGGADGFADGEGATYDVTGSRTDVGESDNTFTYTLNKGTKADNYTIEKTEGKLKVTAATEEVVVTIKENAGTAKYDGTEKTVTGYTVTNISNKLYAEKDFTFNGKAEVKGTDAGTYDMALKASDFTNRNANFSKVTFVIEDGQLVIEKRKVTLTSGSGEKVYDGTALTNGTVTVGGADGFADGEGATYDVTGSRTDVGESDNTFTYTLNKGTKADNYTIEKTEGKLKVTAATEEVVVTIKENAGTAKYDGTEKTVTGYTVTNISNKLYAEKDFTFNGKAEVKGTDAGTYDMALKASDFTNRNANFSKVTFVIEDGQLVIEKRKVTLTSGSGEKVYDGTALTNGTVTVGGADGFADGEGAMYDVTGSRTDVGESDNTFTYTLNEGTKADNYTITKTEGKLKVTAATDEVVVTIKENAGTTKYDGTEKTVTGYTVTNISNKLYTEKDFTFNGTAEVKGTDAGTYDMALKPEDFTNTNANFAKVTFEIEDGQLVIEKRKVTLTSASDEKVYDGTALTNGTVTVGGADGFADGEGATYDVTGSRTDVGESDNTFTYTLNEGTKADNYTITKTEGKLKVTAATDEVVVTIKENAGTTKYDGTEKTVTGYTVTNISNKLYTEKDFTFNGTAEVKGTDAGTYDMALKPEDFTNTNANFAKVTFKIEDGQLVIEKRKVTLTSGSGEKVYDGNALTNGEVTVSGDGFADGEGAAYDVTGSRTDVGESDNTFTYTLNKGTKADNYTIEKTEGKLKVTAATDEVVVTIKENAGTAKYDGTEKTVTGYTVTNISNKLYAEKDFTFNGKAEVKGTDAGTYDMALKASDFTNRNANFSKVTFVIEDGQLVIEKRKVTLTSGSGEKVYDGNALTKKEVTVGGDGFAKDEGVTYTFTGSQTNAGSSKNMFTYAWNEGTKADNYTICPIEGDLVVTPIDGIKVTITGRKDTQTYDGKPHKVEGYDVKPDNPLFTEKDIEFNGEAEATGTDVRIDPYQMGLKPEQFTNTSNNFTNVEFVVEDGQIVITPRAVTLTSETAGKTYDGTALEKPVVTVGGDGFVEGQVTEIKATGSVTNAGSVANTITFTPNKETFKEGNYAITKTEGTLTIAKRSVLITSQSATKTYDGSALTRPAVTITGDGFVPGELAKAEATGSITKVGSTPNAIRYTTTGAFNAANYSIALSVGTLTVTEKPKPEPRRTFNLTINYVYQNGKRAAASYNRGGLKNGETFDITSPVIAGYTASETVVSGTIYNRDIKVTVIYTADGVNLDDYGVPLGLGNITMNVGDCFE